MRLLEGSAVGFGVAQGFESGVHPIEIAVFAEQVDGGFGATTAHPWDVVAAVTGEGLEVHHLVGHHAEFADDTFFADLLGRRFCVGAAAHIGCDVALVIHQLEQIAVAREDLHPPALIGAAVGQGAEHVTAAARPGRGGYPGSLEDLLEVVDVLEEMIWGYIAVGLGLIGFVPKVGSAVSKAITTPCGLRLLQLSSSALRKP